MISSPVQPIHIVVIISSSSKEGNGIPPQTLLVMTVQHKNYRDNDVKNSVNILGVCEVRWADTGDFRSDGFRMIYSGHTT